jgi:hypothetical protein
VDQFAAHYRVRQQIVPLVDIRAAGLNHFTWILSIHDRRTGEDLYPLFRKRFFELDPTFEPLTRDIFAAFGWCPVPGDTHLCEYLPWLSDAQTRPWEHYNIRLYDWEVMAGIRDFGLDHIKMAEVIKPLSIYCIQTQKCVGDDRNRRAHQPLSSCRQFTQCRADCQSALRSNGRNARLVDGAGFIPFM